MRSLDQPRRNRGRASDPPEPVPAAFLGENTEPLIPTPSSAALEVLEEATQSVPRKKLD